MATVERLRDRREAAHDAGWGPVSGSSILAGTFAAFGVIALTAAALAGVAGWFDVDVRGISDDRWREVGMAGAAAIALVLFVAFLFGGYTAGRMAGRSGVRHGFWTFVLGLFIVLAAAVVTNNMADETVVGDELRAQGVPTSADTWTDIGIGAGVAALLAMLAGSLIGGAIGDRRMDRLVRHAVVTDRGVMTTRRDERHDGPDSDQPDTDRPDAEHRDDILGQPMEARTVGTTGSGATELRDGDGDTRTDEGRTLDLRHRPAPADMDLDDEARQELRRPSVEEEREMADSGRGGFLDRFKR